MKEEVYKLISEVAGETVNDDALSLRDDLGLDSLGVVTLFIEIEEQFDIIISESDLDPAQLSTAGDVLHLIEKYI